MRFTNVLLALPFVASVFAAPMSPAPISDLVEKTVVPAPKCDVHAVVADLHRSIVGRWSLSLPLCLFATVHTSLCPLLTSSSSPSPTSPQPQPRLKSRTASRLSWAPSTTVVRLLVSTSPLEPTSRLRSPSTSTSPSKPSHQILV